MEDESASPPEDAADANRLIVFCDAVIAIAITLLALDLPVPHGHTVGELWTSARHDARFFLAFFISFAVIAALWSAHHSIFRYVDRADGRLRRLTFGWLLVIVLIPFAARLLAASGGTTRSAHAILFSVYAVLQLVSSVLFLVMVHHVDRTGLLATDAPPDLRRRVDRQTIAMLVGFALSIPVLFLTPWGWVLWVITPVLGERVLRRFA